MDTQFDNCAETKFVEIPSNPVTGMFPEDIPLDLWVALPSDVLPPALYGVVVRRLNNICHPRLHASVTPLLTTALLVLCLAILLGVVTHGAFVALLPVSFLLVYIAHRVQVATRATAVEKARGFLHEMSLRRMRWHLEERRMARTRRGRAQATVAPQAAERDADVLATEFGRRTDAEERVEEGTAGTVEEERRGWLTSCRTCLGRRAVETRMVLVLEYF
eukprot:GEMP01051888.1.p1 GENE.GEMP01051888.1~~GEMP01051888.1.p1  ORF type:complete len:219 (+),score=85.31 GEMP01051888.1:102-758(+)